MSVGSTPCYRVEPFIKTLSCYGRYAYRKDMEFFQNEMSFTIDDRDALANTTQQRIEAGTLVDPVPEIFYEYCKTHPEQYKKTLRYGASSSREAPDKFFMKVREILKPTHFGLKAVYMSYIKTLDASWHFSPEFDQEEFTEYFEGVWKLSAAPSRLNLDAFSEIGRVHAAERKGEWYRGKNATEKVRHLWIMGNDKAYKRRVRKFTNLDDEEVDEEAGKAQRHREVLAKIPFLPVAKGDSWRSKRIKYIKFSKGYFVHDPVRKETAVLFWKDHERLLGMINARAKIETYFRTYDVADMSVSRLITKAWRDTEELMMKLFLESSWQDCNYIARAFDTVMFTYYADLATDINSRAQDEQQAKWVKENLGRFFDQRAYLNKLMARHMGVKEEVEVLKTYKLLPCPDFCHYSGLASVARKNLNHNVQNLDQDVILPNGMVAELREEEFNNYCDKCAMMTFYSRHNRLPGKLIFGPNVPVDLLAYPNIEPHLISVSDMKFIDLTGAFLWKSFDGIEHELTKDKSTAPMRVDPSMTPSQNQNEKNQVLKYLFDKNYLPQAVAREQFLTLSVSWKKWVKFAWKAETKKPGSRMFGIGTDPDRRNLSELEANIFDYLKNRVGVSVGLSDAEVYRTIYEMSVRAIPGCKKAQLSFDIAGWSPMQDPDFKGGALRKWARYFGMPELVNQMSFFTDRDYYIEKLDHSDTFHGMGVDIEGLHGKLGTDRHADVMGYVVMKCRQMKIVLESCMFACFIDDGILDVQVPTESADDRLTVFLFLAEAIYRSHGLEISWDKTTVSAFFVMYLNEIVVDGNRITPGVKTYINIGEPQDTPIENLMDELESHAATVRGAIKAGTDHNTAYAAYIEEYYFSLKRWSGYADLDVRTLILKTFLPFMLGGFSINSIFSLATNETFDSFEMCVANCRMIALTIPETRNWFAEVFNRSVEDMDDSTILKSPTAFKFGLRALSNRRFPNMVREVILSKSVNPYIQEIARQIENETESSTVKIISHSRIIHETVRALLWKIDPNSMIESIIGKLQSSSTAASLLGFKKVLAIRLVYRLHARKVIGTKAKSSR